MPDDSKKIISKLIDDIDDKTAYKFLNDANMGNLWAI